MRGDRISGEIDYLLKVVARDIADYDRIYRKLTKVCELQDVRSSFAMPELKSTTARPLFNWKRRLSRKAQTLDEAMSRRRRWSLLWTASVAPSCSAFPHADTGRLCANTRALL